MFCNIFVCTSLHCVYHVTEAWTAVENVLTVFDSITVVGALIHCALLHSVRDLKTAQMNVQRCLIRELMLYKFEQLRNNIRHLLGKSKRAFVKSTVTRRCKKFHSCCKNFDGQERLGRLKTVIPRPEFIGANLVSSTQRVSGDLDISRFSVVRHVHHLSKRIQSSWILLHVTKILQNFWLTHVYIYSRYHTITDVYTAALLLTNPSSDDDFGFRHGFGSKASLPLTQSAPAVSHDTTRLCQIVVALWDCQIHADAVRALSWIFSMYFLLSGGGSPKLVKKTEVESAIKPLHPTSIGNTFVIHMYIYMVGDNISHDI